MQRLNLNIFNQSALRGGALNTIRARGIVMNGPLKLVSGNFGEHSFVLCCNSEYLAHRKVLHSVGLFACC